MNSNSRIISKVDPLLFYKSDEVIGYILVHLDDFLFAGNPDFLKTIITKLGGTFLIGKEDNLKLKYLGVNVTSTNSTITLDQYQYIQNLHKIYIHADQKKELTSPLTKTVIRYIATRYYHRFIITHTNWII